MTATKPKVLILGATGQVGGALVPHLADSSGVQIVVGTRAPERRK